MALHRHQTENNRTVDQFLRRQEEKQQEHLQDLLNRARHWWQSRRDFRQEREQNRDFYRGKQWENKVYDPDRDEWVQEKDYLERQNRLPWVMNQIFSTVQNVKGQFLRNRSERAAFAVDKQDSEAVEMINVKRRSVRRENRTEVLEAEQFEEHILSGASAFKSVIEWNGRLDREEVGTYQVDQNRLFFNLDVQDRRLTGLRMVGELHDLTQEAIIAQFAQTKKHAKQLREIYSSTGAKRRGSGLASDYGFDYHDNFSFYQPADPSLNRVIEVWVKEREWIQMAHDPMTGRRGELDMSRAELIRENEARQEQGEPMIEMDEPIYDEFWRVYYLSPQGELLYQNRTPYWHGEHPYTIIPAMHVDGETWGVVSPIRDPQRWMNRTLAQIDHMMAAGSKGALGVDEKAVANTGHTLDDIADWYTRADSVLDFDVPDGKDLDDMIESFKAEGMPAGFFEILPMLQNFMRENSGVSGAAMGEEPKSGTPASLFKQQVIQSNTNVLPYLSSYFDGLHELDRKEIQLIQQAYSDPEMLTRDAYQEPIRYEPQRVRDVNFEVSTGDVADTITHRQLWEQDLLNFLEQGLIPFQIYLMASSHPRSDMLLKLLQQFQGGQPMQPQRPQDEQLPTQGQGQPQRSGRQTAQAVRQLVRQNQTQNQV